MSASGSAPIVIVYDSDVTYSQVTSGTTSNTYDKLTYELLLDEDKKSQFKVDRNTPDSLLGRALSDVFGLAVLYGVTFVLCDLYNTFFSSGRWTSLMWMFLGPWNKITGAPLLHKISRVFDQVDTRSFAVSRCQSKYATAQKECKAKFPFEGSLDDCMFTAELNYQTCMESTPDFQQCQRQATQTAGRDNVGQYCDQQGDDNPSCYQIHTGDTFSETQDCLRAVGYEGVYYGPQ